MERNDNILEDAIPELITALKNNEFGIESYHILDHNNKAQAQGEKVKIAKAAIKLKEGEEIIIRLDQSGWTLEQIKSTLNKSDNRISTLVGTTYESLETLLIKLSPIYVKAMNNEIWKRFGMDAPQ